jgi:hypothetical protein
MAARSNLGAFLMREDVPLVQEDPLQVRRGVWVRRRDYSGSSLATALQISPRHAGGLPVDPATHPGPGDYVPP